MVWQRVEVPLERAEGQGPGGILMNKDALAPELMAFAGQVQCVYMDPPFFTGGRMTFRMRVGEDGWRDGTPSIDFVAYDDFSGVHRDEYLAFLRELIERAHVLLGPTGSFFLHLDDRMAAHARLICDEVFGISQFRNSIIWSYQTGGRSKRYFSRKHDTILFYARSRDHFFDITQVPTKLKRDRGNHLKREVDEKGRAFRSIVSNGKRYIYYDDEPDYPDDVWTDVSQMQQKDPQRTGYATQKPQALTDRIILCSTRPNDLVADILCGSGTALVSAAVNGRRFLGADDSPHAFSVSRKRLAEFAVESHAPLSRVQAMVDASLLPGIGYYSVGLNAYTLAEPPEGTPELSGLDAVDQWYAGLIQEHVFTVYASSVRKKGTPALAPRLEIPMLRGTVALMVIDVYGNRTLWAGAGV
ncbi:MAG: site-specific DNA-methyltransferase [Clostridiales bacterium]|nr:site-specific DNA-methyltransferase [Clostridiales bacterium]